MARKPEINNWACPLPRRPGRAVASRHQPHILFRAQTGRFIAHANCVNNIEVVLRNTLVEIDLPS